MGRNCTICDMPEAKRRDIDRDITTGRSNRAIASDHGLKPENIHYHRKNHLHKQMMKATEIREAVVQMDVFKELDGLMTETREILKRSKKKGHASISLHAIQSLRANITLYAQIRAEMNKQAMEFQDISPEELEQFREWKEGRTKEDPQLEGFIASLPEPYKSEYFRILFEKLEKSQHTHTFPVISPEKAHPESQKDEEFFSGDKANEPFEVEDILTDTPIVGESPSNEPEDDDTPFEEEPKKKKPMGVSPLVKENPWVSAEAFVPGKMKRRRLG